jgi:hypothetical protein
MSHFGRIAWKFLSFLRLSAISEAKTGRFVVFGRIAGGCTAGKS